MLASNALTACIEWPQIPDKKFSGHSANPMIRPGAVVAFVHKGKTRPAIVVRLLDDGARIACAGSTRPPFGDQEQEAILIESNSRDGRRLRLSADTWFKKSFTVVIRSQAELTLWTPATCPSWLLMKLDEFL